MGRKKGTEDLGAEVQLLLKQLLILRLFELGVTQGNIAKKLRVDIHFVNEFLKGIKKRDEQKKP
jgi:hypothetical protein